MNTPITLTAGFKDAHSPQGTRITVNDLEGVANVALQENWSAGTFKDDYRKPITSRASSSSPTTSTAV